MDFNKLFKLMYKKWVFFFKGFVVKNCQNTCNDSGDWTNTLTVVEGFLVNALVKGFLVECNSH